MNRTSKVFAVSGILVVLLTVALGFINQVDWSGIAGVAFLFMIWAEVAFFGGFMLLEKVALKASQPIVRAGGGVLLTLYAVIAFVVSLLHMMVFKWAIKNFFTIQLSLLVAAAILGSILFAVGKSVKGKNNAVLGAAAQIEGFVNRLQVLKNSIGNEAFVAVFGKLAENLRFTDVSTKVSVDEEIEKTISSLEIECMKDTENRSSEQMDALCTKLQSLTEQRKMDVSMTKRGGI